MAAIEFVFNFMPKFDRKTRTLSDWISELEKQLRLAKIEEDEQKIAVAQLLTQCGTISPIAKDSAQWLEDEPSFRREKM